MVRTDRIKTIGIDLVLGATRFVDRHTLAVGERRVRAKSVLIATGSEPGKPALPGLGEVPFLTYREIFENDRLPETMVVIGGGPIGVEIAQAYARLGTRVTISAQRLLPTLQPPRPRTVHARAEGLPRTAPRRPDRSRSNGSSR
ncbi:MAG: FAD-dependent oxidoreductase [Candidatus Velthaea sp.]